MDTSYAAEHGDGWRDAALSQADRSKVSDICIAARAMSSFATEPVDLIAVGEAWGALQAIVAGEDVEVNVELTLGFRSGGDDVREGVFLSVRVNDEAIVLDRMTTSWGSDVGSDHSTEILASLTPKGWSRSRGVAEWLEELDEMCGNDAARLTTSRDHA